MYVLQSPHGQFVVCHNFICCLKDSSVGAFFASVELLTISYLPDESTILFHIGQYECLQFEIQNFV